MCNCCASYRIQRKPTKSPPTYTDCKCKYETLLIATFTSDQQLRQKKKLQLFSMIKKGNMYLFPRFIQGT